MVSPKKFYFLLANSPSARPILSTMEHICGLGPREVPSSDSLTGMSGFSRGLVKCGVRIFVTLAVMAIAILCPSFDRVMALMGSTFCFTICVILPVSFYLRIFGKEISRTELIIDWILIAGCAVLAIVGTVWAFLPSAVTGAL